MALATFTHHSAQRQKTAMVGRWVRDALHGEVLEEPILQPELFQLSEEEPGGKRPGQVQDPRPQERVQRHAVEQFADFAPMVQIFDVPVPQMVDQVVDVLKLLDTAIPEHVIAVPKIPQDPIPHRAVFEPQLAEQWVEVPTAVTFVLGSAIFVDRHGHEWVRVPWCITGGLAPLTPSGTSRRDTPPAQHAQCKNSRSRRSSWMVVDMPVVCDNRCRNGPASSVSVEGAQLQSIDCRRHSCCGAEATHRQGRRCASGQSIWLLFGLFIDFGIQPH